MSVKPWILAAVVASLAGCSGAVGTVKDVRLKGWPDYTIGQMLDKRKICESTEWKSFKDDRGRAIVEYVCVNKPGLEHLRNAAVEAIEREKKEPERMAESDASYLLLKQQAVDAAQQRLQEGLARGASSSEIEQLESSVAFFEKEHLAKKTDQEERRGRSLEQHAERLADLERRSSSLKEVRELFQWAIQDGEPVFLVSQLEVVFSDKTYEWKVNMTEMFDRAVQNSPELHPGYLNALRQMWERYPSR